MILIATSINTTSYYYNILNNSECYVKVFCKAARSKIWFGSSVPVQVLTCDGTGPARLGLYKAQAPALVSPSRETKLFRTCAQFVWSGSCSWSC